MNRNCTDPTQHMPYYSNEQILKRDEKCQDWGHQVCVDMSMTQAKHIGDACVPEQNKDNSHDCFLRLTLRWVPC